MTSKEKLEEIKQHCKKLDTTRQLDYATLLKMEWLIERVERQEKAFDKIVHLAEEAEMSSTEALICAARTAREALAS